MTIAPPPDPYAIFARAQRALRAATYPRTLTYVVHVQVLENDTSRDAHYHEQCNTLTGRIVPDPVSEEERSNPHVPHGINVRVHLGATVPLGRPEAEVDYLGVPQLSPVYAFGLRDVERRDYDVKLVGTERVQKHVDYHLALHPARLSYKLRLRELWIDRKTGAVDRIMSHGNFTAFAYLMSNWSVEFAHVGGAAYITQETTDGPIRVDAHTYSGATLYFENVRTAPMTAQPLSGFSARHVLEEPAW